VAWPAFGQATPGRSATAPNRQKADDLDELKGLTMGSFRRRAKFEIAPGTVGSLRNASS
jgi:hypothetical protein